MAVSGNDGAVCFDMSDTDKRSRFSRASSFSSALAVLADQLMESYFRQLSRSSQLRSFPRSFSLSKICASLAIARKTRPRFQDAREQRVRSSTPHAKFRTRVNTRQPCRTIQEIITHRPEVRLLRRESSPTRPCDCTESRRRGPESGNSESSGETPRGLENETFEPSSGIDRAATTTRVTYKVSIITVKAYSI